MYLADSYPMLNIFWTLLVLSGLVIWLRMLFTVFGDIIHRHDATGLVKAAWTVLILILPLVGVLIYLVVEGKNMPDRRVRHYDLSTAQMESQVRLHARGGAVAQARYDSPHPPV